MQSIIKYYDKTVQQAQWLFIPTLLLFCRFWVAQVFFRSGYLKITNWDTTLYLFELEYQVPLLPWVWAAYLGTAAEIILPPLLLLGLATRPVATALCLVNIVAVISYPTLWDGGFYDHKLWGLMLLIIMIWGAGSLSVDNRLRAWVNRHVSLNGIKPPDK